MSTLLLQRRLTAYGICYFKNTNIRKEGTAHSSPSYRRWSLLRWLVMMTITKILNLPEIQALRDIPQQNKLREEE